MSKQIGVWSKPTSSWLYIIDGGKIVASVVYDVIEKPYAVWRVIISDNHAESIKLKMHRNGVGSKTVGYSDRHCYFKLENAKKFVESIFNT